MAITATDPRPAKAAKTHPAPKNRVWGFLAESNRLRLGNRREPPEPRRKIGPAATKNASGVSVYGYRYLDPASGRSSAERSRTRSMSIRVQIHQARVRPYCSIMSICSLWERKFQTMRLIISIIVSILLLAQISCTRLRRQTVTVRDTDGQSLEGVVVGPQPIVLFGPGNESRENGRVTCFELEGYSGPFTFTKVGFLPEARSFAELREHPEVVLQGTGREYRSYQTDIGALTKSPRPAPAGLAP